MTEAFQSGQFHTGETDKPAVVPSLFQSMADAPQSAVDAEEVTAERLAAAAGTPEETEE